ncbi:MAG: GGDEF domain-containing protein [Thermodesulfovibrionia bacterium]|nr:GGDEF domain-containing protein [Thermodesulfovibrionia bacterium]
MFTISKFTSFPLSTQAIIDSLILICVVIPILYFFLAKPLRLNIVARKNLEKEVETLSISDKLTGFYNRREFFVLGADQLKLAEREKREKVLFCAGLDFLKYINYNLGYQIGDNVLIETAGIIRKSFDKSDIIARIGGDEFAILADGMHEDNIQRLIRRLKTNLDAYNAKAGKTCEISLSIGIKRYNPESPCSIDKLLSDADELMYEEKNLKGKMLV